MGTAPDRSAFVAALVSDGPHPDIPREALIFEPFVGSWALVVRWFDEGGALVREDAGEWHFERVLEGRGIQDVWITPPRAERSESPDPYEYGTSLRFYDPAQHAWQSTWIGPMHGVVRTFTARRVGDAVVLQTTPGAEPVMLWRFSDIAPDRFRWANEVLDDGTWRTQQTFEARRTHG